MRRFVTSALLLGFMYFDAHASPRTPLTVMVIDANVNTKARATGKSETGGVIRVVAQNTATESGDPIAKSEPTQPPPTSNDLDRVCQTLQSAALLNDLPLEFLTRLIWQESRFDPQAVSPKGAQGIAQFMPKTADWVGLANPFNVVQAISKSAELLQSLKRQFGNLGLAAAAYNAGPKRVQDWLSGRRSLPHETEAYIRIVTGHVANEWIAPEPSQLALSLPEAVPCPQFTALFANHRSAKSSTTVPHRDTLAASNPAPAWGVQLIGDASQLSALASYHKLQMTYQAVLGARQPLVMRSKVGKSAFWYRVRIGADSLREAENLCSSLRAAGGSCLVQRNE